MNKAKITISIYELIIMILSIYIYLRKNPNIFFFQCNYGFWFLRIFCAVQSKSFINQASFILGVITHTHKRRSKMLPSPAS